MSKVKITETVLRDSHQSLIATRMTTEEMLPILEKYIGVGRRYRHDAYWSWCAGRIGDAQRTLTRGC